jgi:hypothetical protein
MSAGLYDEDGIDGPFDRRMERAMRDDARRAGQAVDRTLVRGSAMLTPKEARVQGFQLDTTCYPWVAYKGPRFKPEVLEHCLTDVEAGLLHSLERMLGPNPGSDDREIARDSVDRARAPR